MPAKHAYPKRTVMVEDIIAVTMGAILAVLVFAAILKGQCNHAGGDGFVGGQCVTVEKEIVLWQHAD